MQKTIIDEVNDDLSNAVQPDPWFEMPRNTYSDERKFYFEQLARIHEIRELELRVALSNIFVFMATGRKSRVHASA